MPDRAGGLYPCAGGANPTGANVARGYSEADPERRRTCYRRGSGGNKPRGLSLLAASRREQRRKDAPLHAPVLTPERLEALIVTAERPPAPTAISGLGSVVRVEDLTLGSQLSYTLVEAHEAAPARGLLSVESPVGRMLCGRRVGQVVTATTPRGHRRLRVLEVKAPDAAPVAGD